MSATETSQPRAAAPASSPSVGGGSADRRRPSFRLLPGLLAVLLLIPAPGDGAPSGAVVQDLTDLYDRGVAFEEFLAGAERRRDQWNDHWELGRVPERLARRAGEIRGSYRILTVAEDSCGDSVNIVPYLARLVETIPGVEMRVVDSTVGAAVMEARPTPDGRAATPTIVVLDENGREVGSLVERPTELQSWWLDNEDRMSQQELLTRKYAWYDWDRGEHAMAEIVSILEAAETGLEIEPQESGTTELLQAVSVVSERVAWIGGHGGTWGRTVDGGATWETAMVEGAGELQFRDVHAVDADTAWLMSAGSGDASRVFRTDDGGATWTLQITNPDPEGFWDCMDFWDPQRGLLYGDSLADGLVVYRTGDGGAAWTRIPPGDLPGAQEGEGGFAASGTCLVTGPEGLAWIGTGAAATARVLRTDDAGATWSAATVPVVSGGAAGIATLAFRGARHGVALGGDVADHDVRLDNVAVTRDGGRTWETAGRPRMSGAVYGAAWIPGSEPPTLVAVGPRGLDVTTDDASTWRHVDDTTRWAVAFASPEAGWAVGPEGRIDRLHLRR